MKSLVCSLVALCLGVGTIALAAEGEKPKHKYDPEKAFKKLDTNADGTLCCEEFCARVKDKPEAKEKMEKVFKAKDKDADGKLTLDEFKAEVAKKKKKE
jgi:Ca2+-binding EF-hand superfamily protein